MPKARKRLVYDVSPETGKPLKRTVFMTGPTSLGIKRVWHIGVANGPERYLPAWNAALFNPRTAETWQTLGLRGHGQGPSGTRRGGMSHTVILDPAIPATHLYRYFGGGRFGPIRRSDMEPSTRAHSQYFRINGGSRARSPCSYEPEAAASFSCKRTGIDAQDNAGDLGPS